jgi:nicotinamide mononucleotide transporter
LDILKWLFDVNVTLFTVMDYPMSPVELIGTIFGMWCVWLAAKNKVLNWPIGLVNIIFFMVLFWQVQLYSDVLLQIYFFFITFYGWYLWTHPKEGEGDGNNELRVTTYTNYQRVYYGVFILGAVVFLGTIMTNIHVYLPSIFALPAAFPYGDAFTTVLSVVAVVWLSKKKLEAWVLWISVDVVALVLYYFKDIKLVSIEYVIFAVIATLGLLRFNKELKSYGNNV